MPKTAAHVVRRRGRRDANGAFGLGTTTPNYAWDFVNNKARFNNINYGALANTPGWSFTRASTGYAQTSAGALTAFASGELRRTDKGVLIEGARTNLCLQSQTFENASWSKSFATVTADAAVAPDGTTTADKLVEDSSAAQQHRLNQTITVSNATAYTFSVYVKAAERLNIDMRISTATNVAAASFNLQAGTALTPASGTSSITALGNGWYRCSITGTSDSTTAILRINLGDTASNSGPATYNGDGTSGIYLWGAQLEAASFPSSYIPTTTASATRAGDKPSIGSVTGLNYPITIYAEWEKNGDDPVGIYQRVIEVGQTAATDLATIYHRHSNGKLALYATSNNSTVADLQVGTASLNATMKTACRYATNDFTGSLNGAAVQSDTLGAAPAIAPTNIYFGTNYNGDTPLFGYLRRAAIWPRALTDAELQSVTT